jgi:MFS family permease
MANDEQMKLKSNIWKFYLFQAFSGLSFFVPVIVLFWQENGLNLTEIMILQSLFSLTIVLMEVPTGHFADARGRKESLMLSGVFLTSGIFAYTLGHAFFHFLIAEILWAIGTAFFSGADSAFVYDTLKDLRQEGTYKKIWGRATFWYLISASAGSVIGGFIGSVNFRWTFYAMIPFTVLLIPLALSLKEPKRHKHIFKKGYASELLRIVKFSLVENKKIRWLTAYSAIILGFTYAAFFLYQPYFKLSGLDIFYFGIVFGAFNVFAAIISRYSHEIEGKLGQKYSLFLLIILLGSSYLLMSNFIFLLSFSFVFLQQFVRGFSKTVITDYTNRLTGSDIRATVLSTQSLVERLFYASIIPFIGWIADVYSLVQALTISGITTFIAGIIILTLLHKDKVI